MKNSSVDKIILDTLSREHTHLTSLQIYEEIRGQLPAVNPSTVYRALERMANRGIVSISDMGVGAAVYELVAHDLHHHLVCQHCGKIVTIGQAEVEQFFDSIQQKNNFKIATNHLILFGTCGDCQSIDKE